MWLEASVVQLEVTTTKWVFTQDLPWSVGCVFNGAFPLLFKTMHLRLLRISKVAVVTVAWKTEAWNLESFSLVAANSVVRNRRPQMMKPTGSHSTYHALRGQTLELECIVQGLWVSVCFRSRQSEDLICSWESIITATLLFHFPSPLYPLCLCLLPPYAFFHFPFLPLHSYVNIPSSVQLPKWHGSGRMVRCQSRGPRRTCSTAACISLISLRATGASISV